MPNMIDGPIITSRAGHSCLLCAFTFDILLGLLDVGQRHIDQSAGLLAAAVPRILGQRAHEGVQHRCGPVQGGCSGAFRFWDAERKAASAPF